MMDEITTEEMFEELSNRFDGVVLVVQRDETETLLEYLRVYKSGGICRSIGLVHFAAELISNPE